MTSRVVAALVLSLLPVFGCLAQTPLATFNQRGGNTPIANLIGSIYAYAPSVMADGGLYKIWFCTGGSNPTGDHVFYSWSSNLDSGWSQPVNVFGGTGTADVGGSPDNSDFDRTHTCDPSVIRVDGTYYMYYGGNWAPGGFPASPPDPRNGRTAIGVASSPDGLVWTRMNNGKPIITPKTAVDGYYGAGQPSVFYQRGLFYMLYTDTTAPITTPESAHAFVLRSPDPTFQVSVEELQGPGTWVSLTGTPPVPARTWPLLSNSPTLDWRYDDALGAFGVAILNRSNGVDPNDIQLQWYDINSTVNTFSADLPVSWTEGTGLVHRPDGHAAPSAAGTPSLVPVDVMRSVGTLGSPSTYRLAHAGFDYQTPGAKSTATVSLSSSSPNVAPAGLAVTLTANVQAGATGTVTFYDGITALGTVAVSAGSASLSTASLSIGNHSISAFYSGDGSYTSGNSPSIWQAIVQTGRIVNMSTRAHVWTSPNDAQVIGGLIIGGSVPKTVAITAAGPSLAAYGITSPLGNPRFTVVRSSDGALMGSNDNWQSDPNAAQLQALGLAPTNFWEAGMLLTLAPGAYTATVDGVPTGTTLLAAWDAGQPQDPFVNLSTRAWVGAGDDRAISGLIIQDAPRTVLITATGPSLVPYGIPNPLGNPKITLIRSSDGAVLATNDDWMKGPDAGRIQSLSGLAPTNPLESALLATLQPGAYTVIMEGLNGGTGIGVVAVYGLPLGY